MASKSLASDVNMQTKVHLGELLRSVINSVIRTGVSFHRLFVCNLQHGLKMASKRLAIDVNLTGKADFSSCVCLNERSPIKSW